MLTRLGNVLYWVGSAISFGVIIVAIFQIAKSRVDLVLVAILLGVAVILWAVGWFARYILSGSLSIRPMIAVLALISAPAFADNESWKRREVPNPIPTDFNECVRVFPTEKGYANGVDRDKKWGRMDPPLTVRDRALLEYWRREGWAKLVICDHGQS